MKKMKMNHTDITITVRNQREESLVRIFNAQIDGARYYIKKEGDIIGEGLKKEQRSHWMIEELRGLAAAMYYLDMVTHVVTSGVIWEAINKETE